MSVVSSSEMTRTTGRTEEGSVTVVAGLRQRQMETRVKSEGEAREGSKRGERGEGGKRGEGSKRRERGERERRGGKRKMKQTRGGKEIVELLTETFLSPAPV